MSAGPEGVEIVTFGCRLNAWESEVIRGHAAAAGLADVVIVNTCAVTAEAERQARQAIRRARRERPGARILVTGCAAQIDPARYAAMDEVDAVLGNAEKLDPASYAPGATPRVRVGDIALVRETAAHLVAGFADRARAFVEIQQGCDHRCTFCIIPYGRGPNRSVPLGAIVDRVRALVGAGTREVVLTGVDIASYGGDLPGRPTLGATVRRLLALVPELKRLRLSSLDPAHLDADLLRLVETEERLMPHLHLSLQAGDDMILKRMRRRHAAGDAVRVTETLRRLRPGIALGADLIAGFPTETDSMFERTLAHVGDCGLAWLHVFPYSARPGTPAARMPQLPVTLRRARAQRLRDEGDARRDAFLARLVGREAAILVETPSRGRTDHYAEVRLDRDARPGAIARASLTGHSGGALDGSLLA
jgi:threonylcarbamoyladenosine tRNA methylthiotransferase MtaB